jgi:hypothetical protein
VVRTSTAATGSTSLMRDWTTRTTSEGGRTRGGGGGGMGAGGC